MSVILKSVKFAKVLNGRLSFSLLKPYFINGRYITRSYIESRQTKAYATAAYKIEPHEDLAVKNTAESSSVLAQDVNSVDGILKKIDSLIRRTNRTQMKNIYQALSLITSKEVTSSTHALYLIRSCKYALDEHPSKRIDLVNQIWNRCQELGIQFDVHHYNSLLDVHISNGFNFNPAEYLASMEDVSIQPNKDTYLLIMKKYCQDGNINGASEILQHMKKEGLSADEKVFNYLIEGHIKNKDFSGAKEMMEVMESSNLQPNDDTYTAFACGYAAIGDKDEMISYLKKCTDESSIQNYLKVIDALATSGHHEHIDEVFSAIPNKKMFREEFINSCVEMLHKDEVDVGFKLACAAWRHTNPESTNIFIKQLVRGKKTAEEVMHYCQCILDGNLNNQNICAVVASVAAEKGSIDYAISLIRKMTQLGYYLRPSSFWDLFASAKQQKSHNNVWLILKEMFDMGIPADFTTFLEHVYPALGIPKPEDVIYGVKKSGHSLETAADALFTYYCHLGEINYAAELLELFPVAVGSRFDVELFLNNSVGLDKNTFDKYLKVLRNILMDEDNKSVHHHGVVGKLLADLVIKKVNILEAILTKYEDLSFNTKVLNICEHEVLQRNPAREGFVKKLRNMSAERSSMFKKQNLSVEEENKYVKYLQAQNIPCGAFLTKRVIHHIRKKNVARVSELLELFEEMNLKYSPLIFSNLMTLYCIAGDIEKCMEAANKLKSEFPSFKLDVSRLLEYVTNLIKYGKYDETIDALEFFLKQPYTYTEKDQVLKSYKRFIGFLGHASDIEFVKKVQNLLFPLSEEFGSKSLFLEPVIRYHLQRNDLESAFDEFKTITVKYHVPVALNGLLKRAIKMDDKNILQKVTDVATSCSRRTIVLLELAVAFIETHSTQKAMRIIENLGSEIHHKDLEEICMKLGKENKLDELEQLLYITRPLNHVDREGLYMLAIRIFASKNDDERAKKLFVSLQREIRELKPETLNYVQNVLKISKLPDHQQLIPAEALEASKTFMEHLEAGNAETALLELSALKKGYIRSLPLKTMTDLIDLCLQKNCLRDLSSNVFAMSYIIDNVRDVLKPILEKYSAEGDVEKFFTISQTIPDFSLINVNLNAYFCQAYINSGKHEELLQQLEKHVDKKNKLYSQLAFEELLKFPEYEERILNLAISHLNLGNPNPIAYVWACYFVKENFEKADEIFKKHSFQLDKIDVALKPIKESGDAKIALKFVEFVKPLTVKLRIKQKAYGTALQSLVASGMYDEAANLVAESEKLNLDLPKYYMTPLITLKNALEAENKSVPFSISLDAASDSSSVSK